MFLSRELLCGIQTTLQEAAWSPVQIKSDKRNMFLLLKIE